MAAWRECRFWLTPAAKKIPRRPFLRFETNRVLRLKTQNFANLRCSSAAPGWLLLLPILLRKTRKNARKAAFPPNLVSREKNQLTAPRNELIMLLMPAARNEYKRNPAVLLPALGIAA